MTHSALFSLAALALAAACAGDAGDDGTGTASATTTGANGTTGLAVCEDTPPSVADIDLGLVWELPSCDDGLSTPGEACYRTGVDIGPAPAAAPRLTVDYDGDGVDDVVGLTTRITIYFGDGVGGFAERRDLDPGRPLDALVAGDFDGDGAIDLAGRDLAGDLAVLFGGECGAPPLVIPGGPTFRQDLVAGDFNGDGLDDLAANTAELLLVLGDPSRVLVPAAVEVPGDLPVLGVGVGDLDGDGADDLLAASGDRIHAFLGGVGDLVAGPSFAAESGGDILVGDVDGDGRAEVITNDHSLPTSTRLLALDAGALVQRAAIADTRLLSSLADIDGDGDLDVLGFICNGPPQGDVLINEFDSIVSTAFIAADLTMSAGPTASLGGRCLSGVVHLDLDQDGAVELIVGTGAWGNPPSTIAQIWRPAP